MASTRLNSTEELYELSMLLKEGDKEQALAHASTIALVVACMLVGIVGNVIVCVVYSTKIGKSNTNMFILQLGMFDLFVCVVVMPFMLAVLLKTFTFLSNTMCKIYFYSTYLSTSASLLVLMAIALDRYNKVCRPLKPGITIRMATHLFWVSLFVGSILSVSVPYVYGLSTQVYKHHGGAVVNGTTCGILDSVRGSMLHKTHVYTLFAIFIAGYCFIIMLYILVAMRVRRRARRPQPTVTFKDTTFKGQVRFTQQPTTSGIVQHVIGPVQKGKQRGFVNSINGSTMNNKSAAALERFWRSLFLVNHSINPIIYSLLNKQFRLRRVDVSLNVQLINNMYQEHPAVLPLWYMDTRGRFDETDETNTGFDERLQITTPKSAC
ncbi:orexin receptor type 2-like [Liolophura sinensis]|uniref:orexin receptor type 2-like n=1 Tax=Liolophura sinensis TaxID=3198878 RepID=UPI0031594492